MYPVVIGSKNHPSSTQEGSSSYNHKVQANEFCCDREQESSISPKGSSVLIRRRGRRWPKFAGLQVPRRRRFAWSWNFATSRSPVADRRRRFEQRQSIICYFTDGVRNQRLTPPDSLLFRSLLVPSFLRVHLLSSLFFEKIKVICFSDGVASHQSWYSARRSTSCGNLLAPLSCFYVRYFQFVIFIFSLLCSELISSASLCASDIWKRLRCQD